MAGTTQATTAPPQAGKSHNGSLDGLRFVAFLLVFFFHALQWSPWGNLPFIRFGYLGVPIFFVLSGFLIGRILLDLKERRGVGFGLGSKLKTFYIRRSLRIFPVYYLFIGILAALLLLSGRQDPVLRDSFFWHLTYLTNFRSFFAGMDRIAEAHFWSLAVEEHFYLIAPLLVLLVRTKTLEFILGLVIAGVTVAHAAVYWAGSARDFQVLSPMQFDLLALGLATAIIERKGTFLGMDARALRFLGVIGAVFFVLYLRRFYLGRPGIGIVYASFGPLSLGLATAAAVLTLWQRPAWLPSRALAWRPFAYLGQISYGLYLFHPNCLGWTGHYLGAFTLYNSLVGLVVTILVAMLSWHFFERPINDLKGRFTYVNARRPDATDMEAAATALAAPQPELGFASLRRDGS